jgi:hypothetical protein
MHLVLIAFYLEASWVCSHSVKVVLTCPWLLWFVHQQSGASPHGLLQAIHCGHFLDLYILLRCLQLGPDAIGSVTEGTGDRAQTLLTVKNTTFAGVQTAYAYLYSKDMYGNCPATACPDVPVEVRLSWFPDTSSFVNASKVQQALGNGSRAGDGASGVLYADVNAKIENDKFAGKPTDNDSQPSLALYIPFNRPVDDTAVEVRCLRSDRSDSNGLTFAAGAAGRREMMTYPTAWQVIGYINSTMWSPYGAAVCFTKAPGAYVLATYPPVPAVPPPTAAQLNATAAAVSWEYTFQATFKTLADDAVALATFRDWVELSVANATGLPGSSINMTGVRKGSVIADVDVWVPRSYTPAQLAAIKSSLSNATAVFDLAGAPTFAGLTFKGPVAALDPTVPPMKQGPSSTTIGIAVGVAVGGTVLLGAVVAGVVVMRRKRQAVQP